MTFHQSNFFYHWTLLDGEARTSTFRLGCFFFFYVIIIILIANQLNIVA